MGELLIKPWYVYYSAVKRNRLLIHATNCMGLKVECRPKSDGTIELLTMGNLGDC